jgi:SAM-dependent methyltransferase
LEINKRLIACNVCGGRDHVELYPDEVGNRSAPTDYGFSPETRKTYRIVRCRSCGLIFTNPMPSLIASYEGQVDETYLASQRQRYVTARRAVRKILRFKTGGRLLDVGCSTGIFLDEASKHFDVEGLELSRWAAARAAKKHMVHQVTLDKLDAGKPFDVVTLFGVIEHFEDPKAELANVRRLMRPGGLLVIYTGDVDAWLPRLLKKKWWWYQGMHFYYFSHDTLSRMLVDLGFEDVRYDIHTVDFELGSLAVSLNRYSVGRLLNSILTLPGLRNISVPLRLSGEMLLFASYRG